MLQRALDIYRSKFMPSLQPRKNSKRTAPIPPPPTTVTPISPEDLLSTVPLTMDALSAQNAFYEKSNPTLNSPAMSNMSGTTESLDFADCFSLAEEEEEDVNVFCNLLLQPSAFIDTSSSSSPPPDLGLNSTSSYSSDSTACTPSPTNLPMEDPFTADFFDQFILPSTDDPFYMLDTTDLSKLYSNTTTPFSLDPLF